MTNFDKLSNQFAKRSSKTLWHDETTYIYLSFEPIKFFRQALGKTFKIAPVAKGLRFQKYFFQNSFSRVKIGCFLNVWITFEILGVLGYT